MGTTEPAREFRVMWKREGRPRRVKVYKTRRGAERFLRLFGPEPWSYGTSDPNARHCNYGPYECPCGGRTNREYHEMRRAEMQPLEYLRLQARPIGGWRTIRNVNGGVSLAARAASEPDGATA